MARVLRNLLRVERQRLLKRPNTASEVLMNVRLRNCIFAAVAMLLAAGSAWADASSVGYDRSGGRAGGYRPPQVRPPQVRPVRPPQVRPPQAPEIDAGSGTTAIGLVSGMLLLMRERARSKRVSKSEKKEE